jgi:hypothetical protein
MVATIEKTKLELVEEVASKEPVECEPGFCGFFDEDGTFYGISIGPVDLAIKLDIFDDGRVSIGDEMHHIRPDLIEGELADEWEPSKELLLDYMRDHPEEIVIE